MREIINERIDSLELILEDPEMNPDQRFLTKSTITILNGILKEYDKNPREKSFYNLVAEMRSAQKRYFELRGKNAYTDSKIVLQKCKILENKVDDELNKL